MFAITFLNIFRIKLIDKAGIGMFNFESLGSTAEKTEETAIIAINSELTIVSQKIITKNNSKYAVNEGFEKSET